MLAIADANAKFIFIDVGYNGRLSDGGAFQRSNIMHIFDDPEKYLPKSKKIGSGRTLSFAFVGDNAFPLLGNLMTPYKYTTTVPAQINFNRRLSRSRQTVERAFGILANRFQVLSGKIRLLEEKAKRIVMCCCVLHNFLAVNSEWYLNVPADNGNANEIDAGAVDNPTLCRSRAREGQINRENFCEYFNNEGRI